MLFQCPSHHVPHFILLSLNCWEGDRSCCPPCGHAGDPPRFKRPALRHDAPSSAWTSEGTELLHFQEPVEVWPVAYRWLRAGIENDLNGSSEAKCRLSGTAVSTKNSFIDRLSPSYSLNLLSLSSFPPSCYFGLLESYFFKAPTRKTARHTCTYPHTGCVKQSKDCDLWGNFTLSHIRAVTSGGFYPVINLCISCNVAPGMAMSVTYFNNY